MPTIEQSDKVITNLSDFVAMEMNSRDASFFVKMNRSVAGLPILIVRNGSVHQGFDFTHGWLVATDLMVSDKWGAPAPH